MSTTKTIKYVGRHRSGVHVPIDPKYMERDPDLRDYVEVKYLGTVTLPVVLANSLLEQEDEWHPVKAAKSAAKRAAKKPAPEAAESAQAPADADTPPADDGAPQED